MLSSIIFKVSNYTNKENYPIYHEMLKLPIFKEDTDEKLYNNQNNQVDESPAPRNILYLKSSEITTKESNNQEIKNNIVINEKKTGDTNTNLFAIEIPLEEEDKKERIKCGRKRKGMESGGQHSKYSDDNLRRKVKHIVLSHILDFMNDKIKEIYHGNIGQGMFIKKLLIINHQQKANINVKYNKNFLTKTLGDIFSDDLSNKFTNYPKDHNRNLIKTLTNEEDESKRIYFSKLFNLTFLEGLEHFRGSRIHEELIGLKGYHEELEKYYNEKEYKSCLNYYINNFESIIRNKKSRNRKKSETKSNEIII